MPADDPTDPATWRRQGIVFEADVHPGGVESFSYRTVTTGAIIDFIPWPKSAKHFEVLGFRVTPHGGRLGPRRETPLSEPVPFAVNDLITISIRNHTTIARRFFGALYIARTPLTRALAARPMERLPFSIITSEGAVIARVADARMAVNVAWHCAGSRVEYTHRNTAHDVWQMDWCGRPVNEVTPLLEAACGELP